MPQIVSLLGELLEIEKMFFNVKFHKVIDVGSTSILESIEITIDSFKIVYKRIIEIANVQR